MKTIILKNKKELKLYDSIDEMPIVNFQKYNKFLLLDSGLGSDINSVDEHITNLARLVKSDIAKAMQELQNLRQNLHLIVSEISPKYMAFAALIYSVDGEVVENLSDDSLKQLLCSIKDIKHSSVVEFLLGIKKKLALELETYFPTEFNNAKEKETYDKLKQRTLFILHGIIEDKDTTKEVNEIDEYLFGLYTPKIYTGSKSVEVKYDKQFETSCMLIGQKTNLFAKSMTVLEFYNTLSIIEKQVEAELKAYKRTK